MAAYLGMMTPVVRKNSPPIGPDEIYMDSNGHY